MNQPSEKTITEASRHIPVSASYDVLVCGGGPAGIAAALSAARSGARTGLIELHGCLGGVWTAGLLSWIIDHENKTGIMPEILQELQARGGRAVGADGKPSSAYDAEIMKWTLEEMAVNAGVGLRYHTRVCAASVNESKRLTHVMTESKSGREAIAADVFIDATGDGDLGALAGCSFETGHPDTGATQPMTLMALVTGLEARAIRQYFNYDAQSGGTFEPKERLYELLAGRGVKTSYSKPTLFWIRDDLFAFMANHEYGVAVNDARAITQATLHARSEVNHIVKALAGIGGAWRNIRLVTTGAQLGVREGRRIHGLYQVDLPDLLEGSRHDDAVCRGTFMIDIHAFGTGQSRGLEKAPGKTKPYDIPARALVAKDVDGLIMAGRCISGDFFAHASYRVTGNAVQLGEAAGRIAADCSRQQVLPRSYVTQTPVADVL